MKLRFHALFCISFAQWPVSQVHRKPVFEMLNGCYAALDALGLQGSEAQMQEVLRSLPNTPDSALVINDSLACLQILNQHNKNEQERPLSTVRQPFVIVQQLKQCHF